MGFYGCKRGSLCECKFSEVCGICITVVNYKCTFIQVYRVVEVAHEFSQVIGV